MIRDFIIAFCGDAPVLSFSNLPECFLYFSSIMVLIISLSVVIRGIYSVVAAGFRNKI